MADADDRQQMAQADNQQMAQADNQQMAQAGGNQQMAQAAGAQQAGPAAAQVQVAAAEAQLQVLREMVETLRRNRPGPAPVQPANFKPPKFNGIGNVETFIQQFIDVTEANEWTPAAAILHIRGCLEEEARECGAAGDLQGVFAALRARFGLTPREARTKLSRLRREYKTTLQEHSSRVASLAQVAYPELDPGTRQEMALEHFVHSLSYVGLQQHLLAVRPDTLEEAVSAGNEYMQVKQPGSAGVRQIEIPEDSEGQVEEEGRVEAVAPPPSNPMEALMAAVTQLTQGMKAIQQMMARGKPSQEKVKCYNCGKLGHYKSQCQESTKDTKQQGNQGGQQ